MFDSFNDGIIPHRDHTAIMSCIYQCIDKVSRYLRHNFQVTTKSKIKMNINKYNSHYWIGLLEKKQEAFQIAE